MGEIRKKIRYVMVDMKCDHCKDGYMRLVATIPFLGKKMHIHKCDKCGFVDNYDVRYPYKIDE